MHYGGMSMKKVMVRLKDADEIKHFNKVVSRFDCDFDLQLAKNMIDAKSLLGLFALQFNTAMDLIIHADGQLLAQIEDAIKPYIDKAVS